MARSCTICTHPERDSINLALVAGDPYWKITETYGVSAPALSRHRSHIPVHLRKASEAGEVEVAGNLLSRLESRLDALCEEAAEDAAALRRQGDYRGATTTVRVRAQINEITAKFALTADFAARLERMEERLKDARL